MANPLYWEDQVSSTAGGQTEMIVDAHHPSFTVTYGVGKYDHVTPDHANLLGASSTDVCRQCGRGSNRIRRGLCESCQFGGVVRTLAAMTEDPTGPLVRCSQCARADAADLRSPHNVGYQYTPICVACHRAQHADEQRRMANDQPMGSNKRTPITLDRTR